MAIAVDKNYDRAQRKISTANLKQFAGVDCQLLVEKETHRPIIMDGATIGGKFKCASIAELKAVETVANNAISQAYADEHYLGKTAKAVSAGTADTATKATQDARGNVITSTYATKTEVTSGLATKQPAGDYRTKSELDNIYLGINAKAKSAITADTATRANSVNWNNVQGKPSIKTGILRSSGNLISIYTSGDWTAPQDVLCDISTQADRVNGTYVLAMNGVTIASFYLDSEEMGPDVLVFVPKGYTLSFKYGSSGGTMKGSAYPYTMG